MHRQHGITLAELLTALAIAAVVSSLAWPAFSALHARTGAATVRHRLTATLMTARSTAVMRREAVSVCPSDNGRRCSGRTDWSAGWIVFEDPGNDAQPLSDDRILKRGDALPTSTSVESSAGRTLVRFQRDGRAYGSNLTLRICHRTTRQHLASVILSNAGRARMQEAVAGARCT